MKLLLKIDEVRGFSQEARAAGKSLGLVPTMGALHEGHLSLVRAARRSCQAVVVSIFVNPTQFSPAEDFSRYPRDLKKDCGLLAKEGVDCVFAPAAEEIYPEQGITWVTVEGMSERLCGKSRPGHFRGVTTVVAKLFHVVGPDLAFFGQKDAAQAAIIRRMVRDLNLPVRIEVMPIVREPDGLAMSSRNSYLSPQEREPALVLHRSLARAQKMLEQGERHSEKLTAAAKQEIAQQPAVRLDYFEIVDPDTLESVTTIHRPSLAAVAAFVGKTRLIDNILLEPRD